MWTYKTKLKNTCIDVGIKATLSYFYHSILGQ